MEANQESKGGVVAKYCLITVAMLVAYFLIMDFLDLTRYPLLRVINYPLIAIGVFFAVKEMKQRSADNRVGYLEGFGIGFMVVLFTAVVFSLFVFFYARAINPSFVNLIWTDPMSHNFYTNTVGIGIYTFAETIIFGVVLVFIVMQYYKRDDAPSSEE